MSLGVKARAMIRFQMEVRSGQTGEEETNAAGGGRTRAILKVRMRVRSNIDPEEGMVVQVDDDDERMIGEEKRQDDGTMSIDTTGVGTTGAIGVPLRHPHRRPHHHPQRRHFPLSPNPQQGNETISEIQFSPVTGV